MENWPDESNTLRFCSRRCLDEYKLEILKRETIFCMSKSAPDDCFSSAAENNMSKRRVCATNEKRRKRRKEPRPHPSYRLNKRYWDDIRAGRRVHDVPPSLKSPQRSTSNHRGNTLNFPTFTSTIPHLSFPLITTAPTVVPPCVPCAFSSIHSESLFTESFVGTLKPKIEADDIIDVTTCDDNTVKMLVNPNEKQKSDIQISDNRPRESDVVVDEIADAMFKESMQSNKRNGCEKADTKPNEFNGAFMPIAVPIPMPILIPLSDAFILKYFTRTQ